MPLILVRPDHVAVEIHECSGCSAWARDTDVDALGWFQEEGEWRCETCTDDSGDYWAPWR